MSVTFSRSVQQNTNSSKQVKLQVNQSRRSQGLTYDTIAPNIIESNRNATFSDVNISSDLNVEKSISTNKLSLKKGIVFKNITTSLDLEQAIIQTLSGDLLKGLNNINDLSNNLNYLYNLTNILKSDIILNNSNINYNSSRLDLIENKL